MALTERDRNLLQACLRRAPRAWEDFVDRFLGLMLYVVKHTAQARSRQLGPQDREDLVADVFLALVQDDFAVLRRFRGHSSLATYLTVIARRVVVRKLWERQPIARPQDAAALDGLTRQHVPGADQRISQRDEVERLLHTLHGPEAEVIRMYYLEGQSYRAISASVGMPENSIGPTLSRARAKLRRSRGFVTAKS